MSNSESVVEQDLPDTQARSGADAAPAMGGARDEFYHRALEQQQRMARPHAAPVNQATAILLAAAHVHTDELHAEFRKRALTPLRADTEELGLDLPLIHDEVRKARTSLIMRDVSIGLVFIFGFLLSASLAEDSISGVPYDVTTLLETLLAIAAVVFIHRSVSKARVRSLFRHPPLGSGSSEQAPNVVISGGYSPLLGAGIEINSWSFTVNVQKPENETRPVQGLSVPDLFRETEQAINAMGMDGPALSNALFVDGRDVQAIPQLFNVNHPSKPRTCLDADEFALLAQANDNRLRHYKVMRNQLWGGQIVLSTYFKYARIADTLFIEARTFLLPPLHERFTSLERIPLSASLRDLMLDVGYSLAASTAIWTRPILAAAQFATGGFVQLFHDPVKHNRKAVARDRRYNFGWPQSLRERWASHSFDRYFQMVDQDFYSKMIKQTLLDSLVDSLERRNICTAELTEATTRIFNDGIVMSGGTIKAQNLAVGKRAQAFKQFLGGRRGRDGQQG